MKEQNISLFQNKSANNNNNNNKNLTLKRKKKVSKTLMPEQPQQGLLEWLEYMFSMNFIYKYIIML